MRVAPKLLIVIALFVASTGPVASQETGFLDRSVTIDAVGYRYQVYVPREFRRTRPWPVILFLHGGGQYGRDGISQTNLGLAPAVRQNPERFPAVIVFPQVPPDGTPGFQRLGERVALAALDQTVAEFSGDLARVYVTGLSMGGNGAWSLAYRHPHRFAALVVVCGFIGEFTGRQSGIRYPAIVPDSVNDPYSAIAQRISHIPIWIFHGDADLTVPVDVSRRMAAALKANGADVKYTELAGIDHAAGAPTYGREDLFNWLFKQVKR
ncbi:MAG: prolyl oligopeptidase family serine peptidase [Gemmatimonadota bacterium]